VLSATSIAAVLVYGCATILSGRDRAEVRLAAVEVEGAEA
jgi:hypothetical protein